MANPNTWLKDTGNRAPSANSIFTLARNYHGTHTGEVVWLASFIHGGSGPAVLN